MLNTAVILNGPPGSGKDTIAELLRPYGFFKREFKARLYQDTIEEFFLTGELAEEFMFRATHRRLKELPWDALSDPSRYTDRALSPREALIHTSENIKKPSSGDDYFGKAAAEDCIADYAMRAVFSDGGFASEIPPLIEAYRTVYIIKLLRTGFTFQGDSRTYLENFPNTFSVELIENHPRRALRDILDILYINNETQLAL